MRKISSEQADQILAASAEGFSNYPPAALEKDIHLTAILNLLTTLPASNCQVTFGGGTSLVKGFQLFDRMSEDLDFKTAFVNQVSSQGEARKSLSELKNKILDTIQSSEFGVKLTDEGNANKRFAFDVQYEPVFEQIVSLRDRIQLEFTFSELTQPPVVKAIRTLLSSAINMPSAGFSFSCVAEPQTAVEKVVGFFSKYEPDTSSKLAEYDGRIVRHIHDSYFLRKSLTEKTIARGLLESAVEEDLILRGRISHSTKENVLSDIRAKVIALGSDKSLASYYSVFVDELVSGKAPAYEEALNSFIELTDYCLRP